jgi:hypothetical protein
VGIDGRDRLLYCLPPTFGISTVAGEYPSIPSWKLKR